MIQNPRRLFAAAPLNPTLQKMLRDSSPPAPVPPEKRQPQVIEESAQAYQGPRVPFVKNHSVTRRFEGAHAGADRRSIAASQQLREHIEVRYRKDLLRYDPPTAVGHYQKLLPLVEEVVSRRLSYEEALAKVQGSSAVDAPQGTLGASRPRVHSLTPIGYHVDATPHQRPG